MTVDIIREGTAVTVMLDGWLNVESVSEFAKVTEELSDYTEMKVDFDKVEYMSSAGLRQIVSLFRIVKAHNAEFEIVNVRNNVMEVFRLTGIDKKMTIKSK